MTGNRLKNVKYALALQSKLTDKYITFESTNDSGLRFEFEVTSSVTDPLPEGNLVIYNLNRVHQFELEYNYQDLSNRVNVERGSLNTRNIEFFIGRDRFLKVFQGTIIQATTHKKDSDRYTQINIASGTITFNNCYFTYSTNNIKQTKKSIAEYIIQQILNFDSNIQLGNIDLTFYEDILLSVNYTNVNAIQTLQQLCSSSNVTIDPISLKLNIIPKTVTENYLSLSNNLIDVPEITQAVILNMPTKSDLLCELKIYFNDQLYPIGSVVYLNSKFYPASIGYYLVIKSTLNGVIDPSDKTEVHYTLELQKLIPLL